MIQIIVQNKKNDEVPVQYINVSYIWLQSDNKKHRKILPQKNIQQTLNLNAIIFDKKWKKLLTKIK